METTTPVFHYNGVVPDHATLKSHVSQDSPTMSRAYSISVRISLTPIPRFLRTSATPAKVMGKSSLKPSDSASSVKDMMAGQIPPCPGFSFRNRQCCSPFNPFNQYPSVGSWPSPLQLDSFPPLITATIGTNDLLATASGSHIYNGSPEHCPFFNSIQFNSIFNSVLFI